MSVVAAFEDPALPGLDWALSLGRLRTHRLGRRATVESACGSFIKVVQPPRAASLRTRYERLGGLALVPEIETSDDELGVLVLSRCEGRTLRQTILGGRELPSAARIEAALWPLWDAGLVHGDFHDANVLVTAGEVSGLVDLDRSEHGPPELDLATLVAHLHALAIYRPDDAATVTTYASALRRAWAGRFDLDLLIEARLEALARRAEQVGRLVEAAALRTRNEAARADRLVGQNGVRRGVSRRA